MSARRETLRKFALVTKIDVLFEKREEKERGEEEEKGKEKEKEKGKKEEKPTSAWESLHGLPDDNPVIVSEELQRTLREGASSCDFPFLMQDAFQVFFACIQTEEGYVYLGPLSMARMDKPSERRFYLHYGINPEDVHSLRVYTLQEILYLVELADQILTGRTYEDTQLLYLNHLNKMDPDAKGRQQALFLLEEEDKNEDEEDVWRHTYREERGLMDAVREGRTEDALRLSRLMDQDCGRLSRQEVTHWRNLAIVGISLTSRAAIEGGLSPQAAYRISGYYIMQCDAANSMTQLLGIRDVAIRELTERVFEKQNQQRTSAYTESAKNYIANHYREKIYLEKVAEVLGISPAYLSRLFKKDTGILLQDYIVKVRVDRACNLLRYSDESLSTIAEYVGFASQSYFGKVFKKEKHMTPKAFRDQHKAIEETHR